MNRQLQQYEFKSAYQVLEEAHDRVAGVMSDLLGQYSWEQDEKLRSKLLAEVETLQTEFNNAVDHLLMQANGDNTRRGWCSDWNEYSMHAPRKVPQFGERPAEDASVVANKTLQQLCLDKVEEKHSN